MRATLTLPKKTIKMDITEGTDLSILFLGGFRSSMTGTKAQFLKSYSTKKSYKYACFQYSGHGDSTLPFEDCTISDWLEEAEAVFHHIKSKKNILIGSSMGGWLATLLAEKLSQDISGLLTLAAAPEFPQRHIMQILPAPLKEELSKTGRVTLPDFDGIGSYTLRQDFFTDAQSHPTLSRPVSLTCPVRLIHGSDDTDIAPHFSKNLHDALDTPFKHLRIISGGSHRLGRDQDLSIITEELESLIAQIA